MRFVLLTEGKTEKVAIRAFLHRALNARLTGRVGVSLDQFDGNAEYFRKAPRKAQNYLAAPDSSELIAVIGLLDLYGLPPDWQLGNGTDQRYRIVKSKLEKEVGNSRFRQHLAVHETEAWLLSDTKVFPASTRARLQGLSATPETVDLDSPPAGRLNQAYLHELNRGYKKTVDGKALFDKLDPGVVLAKCPYFKTMIDEMVGLAKSAGA